MKKDIGVGIIGLKAGGDLLALNLEPESHMRVVAVCDDNGQLARNIAARNQIPFVTTDPIDLLSQPGVDMVAVFGAARDRHDHCLAALRSGKHVLCGTPMAASLNHARELALESKRDGVRLFVANPRRWTEEMEAARNLYVNGELGDLRVIEAHVFADEPSDAPARAVDLNVGFAVLCETFDLLRWIAGEITEVHAVGGAGDVLVNLRFTNGSIGRAMALRGNNPPSMPRSGLSIYGTKGAYSDGRVVLDRIAGRPAMTFATENGRDGKSGESGVLRCARQFESSLYNDTPLPADAWDGAKSIAVCAAVEESLHSGQPATVPPVEPPVEPPIAPTKRSASRTPSAER